MEEIKENSLLDSSTEQSNTSLNEEFESKIKNLEQSKKEIIQSIIEEKSPETSDEVPSESVDIKEESANTTNCLALTIQEDHKLVALKNVFLRSIRMSWKVAVSTITLALLKLFS